MRGVPQYVEAYLPHVLVDRALDGEQLLLGDRIPRFRVVRRHGLQPFELVVVMVRFAEVVEFRGELGELFQDCLRTFGTFLISVIWFLIRAISSPSSM